METGACHWGATWFVGSYMVLSQQDCVSPHGIALLLLVLLHEVVTSLNARPFKSSPQIQVFIPYPQERNLIGPNEIKYLSLFQPVVAKCDGVKCFPITAKSNPQHLFIQSLIYLSTDNMWSMSTQRSHLGRVNSHMSCFTLKEIDFKKVDHVHRWIIKSMRNLEAISHEELFKILKLLVQKNMQLFTRK